MLRVRAASRFGCLCSGGATLPLRVQPGSVKGRHVMTLTRHILCWHTNLSNDQVTIVPPSMYHMGTFRVVQAAKFWLLSATRPASCWRSPYHASYRMLLCERRVYDASAVWSSDLTYSFDAQPCVHHHTCCQNAGMGSEGACDTWDVSGVAYIVHMHATVLTQCFAAHKPSPLCQSYPLTGAQHRQPWSVRQPLAGRQQPPRAGGRVRTAAESDTARRLRALSPQRRQGF